MEGEHDDELQPGTLFGRYRIERRIGAGAMGAVYLATHVGLNKPVVVKVLLPHHAKSRAIRQRFLREGEAAARIRHPHVVDVTDVGMHEQMPFLVMEHLEGETLGAMLDRDGAMPSGDAVALLLPILGAVDAAHAVGVVHRDLKPENIFVARSPTGDPHAKVLDFGISRVVSDEGARQTGTAAMLGTPSYMAPEQITSSRDADARSDQYSLGVILYECITGQRPFNGENIYMVLRQVGEGIFLPPRAVKPDIPSGLEAVVMRAMSRDPAARFPSLREMSAAMIPFASERGRLLWGGSRPPAPPIDPGVIDTLPDRNPPKRTVATAPGTQVDVDPAPRVDAAFSKRPLWQAVAAVVGVLAVGAIAAGVGAATKHAGAEPSATPREAPVRSQSTSATPLPTPLDTPAVAPSETPALPSVAPLVVAAPSVGPAPVVTARHGHGGHHTHSAHGHAAHPSAGIDLPP